MISFCTNITALISSRGVEDTIKMPVVLLERIPLPSLQTYTAISTLLLSCAFFYAYQTVISVEELTKIHNDLPAVGVPVDSQPVEVPMAMEPTVAGAPPQTDSSETTEELNGTTTDEDIGVTASPVDDHINITLPYDHLMLNIMYVLGSEVWCVWVGL